ncbi:MAG: hypothetical protein Ct9H90mP27_5190 [Gammaproteobacteria bacterium]|nr:MAG: hypothetical protein Ct9H90mP27_5190 [Gammaproteobacteria bacterium]
MLVDPPLSLSFEEPEELSPPDFSSELDTFFFFPDLKSVSYQPLPLNLKPAADIFFRNFLAPQASHFFSGASLTFCKVSNSCPQLSQIYSNIGIKKFDLFSLNRGHDHGKSNKNTALLSFLRLNLINSIGNQGVRLTKPRHDFLKSFFFSGIKLTQTPTYYHQKSVANQVALIKFPHPTQSNEAYWIFRYSWAMRQSKILIPTLKEDPSDAEVVSHKLMMRAGLVRQLASGLYSWLPLGLRVLQKVENIIRVEMDNAGAQEL